MSVIILERFRLFICTIWLTLPSRVTQLVGYKWVREPDNLLRQSSGFYIFTQYTCTVVTQIYSAV